MKRKTVTALKWTGITVVILALLSRFIISNPVFDVSTSTVLEASNGHLLGARIAEDGQWRFPQSDSIPKKFEHCILNFEDQYFHYHPGVNPGALLRSFRKNISAGRIIQGGSTISMQVARMIRNGKSRNYYQKLIETFLAFHLEINYSKDEILSMYVSNAPFGGNVVGLDAASWRYFGRSPFQLSWSEYAVLAVLPNAPSLIYPGKNHHKLKQKRDRLLDKLKLKGIIDAETCSLAKLEELPSRPMRLPQSAPHALDYVYKKRKGARFTSTIDRKFQQRSQEVLNIHVSQESSNEIYNGAALILKVDDGRILSYVGNSTLSKEHDNAVDVITAPRSTGSILKPMLYASALSSGELLPQMLLPDVPTYISGYAPKNYFPSFDGVVPADEALYRSLNVPFVRLLQQYGVHRFYDDLKKLQMSTLTHASSHYGLSLILGGAEARLKDLASIYAGMARMLNSQNDNQEHFFTSDLLTKKKRKSHGTFSLGAVHSTFEAMTQVRRPVSEQGWQSFESGRKVAWKTGTSFGNKDAWAIGVTPEYVVAVWMGNADGEGRPGLTGVSTAAPLMFSLFDLLGPTTWFPFPYESKEQTDICKKSGYRASINCDEIMNVWLPRAVNNTLSCPYHRMVHLSKNVDWQVNADCQPASSIVNKAWFVLPPMQEWYYKRKSPLYKSLPPLHPDCRSHEADVMEFIYPKNTSQVYIPIELDGTKGKVIFELAHRTSGKQIFWHLDGRYLGSTLDFHQMDIDAPKGDHELVVVDEDGQELRKKFYIMNN